MYLSQLAILDHVLFGHRCGRGGGGATFRQLSRYWTGLALGSNLDSANFPFSILPPPGLPADCSSLPIDGNFSIHIKHYERNKEFRGKDPCC